MSQKRYLYSFPPPDEKPVYILDEEGFDVGLGTRDLFLGNHRCVICGFTFPAVDLQNCNIIGYSDAELWEFLRWSGWVPEGMNGSAESEPRNSLLLCAKHNTNFKNLRFFIRYRHATRQYIFVDYDGFGRSRMNQSSDFRQFHGKAIALNGEDRHAPLPLLFLVHEYMVRARNFFHSKPDVEVSDGRAEWPSWVVDGGVVSENDGGMFSFKRTAPTSLAGATGQHLTQNRWNVQTSPTMTSSQVHSTPESGSETATIKPPTDDLVKELRICQRTMPCWNA